MEINWIKNIYSHHRAYYVVMCALSPSYLTFFFLFFISEFLNCFIVVTSIFILSSTSQIEAHPVQKRQVPKKMTESSIKEALKPILTGCQLAIVDSETAIDTYVSNCFVNLFFGGVSKLCLPNIRQRMLN